MILRRIPGRKLTSTSAVVISLLVILAPPDVIAGRQLWSLPAAPSLHAHCHGSIPSTAPLSLLDLRGGASKSRTKTATKKSGATSISKRTATGRKSVRSAQQAPQSAMNDVLGKYKKILPLTRIYITMVGVATLTGLVLGEELTQTLFALDPLRVVYGWEFWRVFTAASFLGPPSIGWLMSGYYLFEYGSSLERAYGTAQHLMFLLTQLVVLSGLSMLVGQPFFAPSMITAMLHVLSRAMPYQKVKWLIFTVPYWSLPYGLMAGDVLQAQSGLAAVPHILGILSGHFYHFYKFLWPKIHQGEDWLVSPSWVARRLDPDHAVSTATLSSALKGRKKGKGRKLGRS